MTRQLLPFFHNLQKRATYSKILIPPKAAVTMEKTAFGERSVPYQRPKYRASGMTMESKRMRNQKMKILRFLARRS